VIEVVLFVVFGIVCGLIGFVGGLRFGAGFIGNAMRDAVDDGLLTREQALTILDNRQTRLDRR
jgi:hypothetical protein